MQRHQQNPVTFARTSQAFDAGVDFGASAVYKKQTDS